MKKIILLVLMLVATISYGQRDKAYVDETVAKFTNSLKERGIDTFFYTTRYCDGNIEMISMPNGRMCSSKGTFYNVYVFWQENETYYGKKIDNCGLFGSVEINGSVGFNFYIDNASKLKKNSVKPYDIAKKKGGPIQRTEINNCHKDFFFASEGSEYTQSFKPFDLTNDAKEKNVNFEYNNGLKIVALDKMLDKAIAEINSHPNLVRL